jgi:hypothetical protein
MNSNQEGALTFVKGYLGPSRLEGSVPISYRVAEYPDGRKIIQGAYSWSEGSKGGLTWRDIPMVSVDENGKEIA